MIRELVTDFVLLLVLAGITGSVLVIQKSSEKQMDRVERIMEEANAPY